MSKQIINKNNYLNITTKRFYIKTADENCHVEKLMERQVGAKLGGEEILGLIKVDKIGSALLVADCGQISFQTVRWLMRETNLSERASPAINATQC